MYKKKKRKTKKKNKRMKATSRLDKQQMMNDGNESNDERSLKANKVESIICR
jgi:hypothetical protein